MLDSDTRLGEQRSNQPRPLSNNAAGDEHMSVSIEPLKEEHFDTDTLRLLLRGIPSEYILPLEQNGGMAQAVNFKGTLVGVITVMQNGEAMIGIDPSHHRQGIASAALMLAKPVAISRSIRSITAKTRIGSASNRLLTKFGARELKRSDSEIWYRVDL
ncbi:TPA: GNAT family N-acetyltransferase [Stenotrophomonas maltophilia]